MNFNNGLYVFSEVPGYDASKGEPGIVKAFQKLWTKIANFEQVRILEKKTKSAEVQTNNEQGLTLADVRYKILLTQLHYVIKITREFSNSNSSIPKCEVSLEKIPKASRVSPSPDLKLKIQEKPDERNGCENTLQSSSSPVVVFAEGVSRNFKEPETDRELGQFVATDEAIGIQSAEEFVLSTKSTAPVHPKISSQPHYHLKLDDIPFILGASTSASHSVVANVQSIIARMKMHNKALCAPRPQARHNTICTSTDANEANTKMLQELSEELSKLTKKQENLKQRLDNAHGVQGSMESRNEVESSFLKKERMKGDASNNCCLTEETEFKNPVPLKNSRVLLKDKLKESSKKNEKHLVPKNKIKTNSSLQLTRHKILRSLQDFKMHLSEEDLSWN